MVKVSIIVPVYNTSKYLKKCLDSILNQKYKNIELIIINDGSTDNSLQIINEYKHKDDRLVLIDKKNSGQADCRNIGIDVSTGDYLMFVDSDDYIEDDAVTLLVEKISETKDDILCFDYYSVIDDLKKREFSIQPYSDNIKINYYLSNPCPWNKIFKTSILKQQNFKFLVGYIYEDLATIPLTTFYTDKIGYIKVPLYNYIIRGGSSMRQKKYNEKLENIYIALEYLENNTKKYTNSFDKELEFMYLEHLIHGATLRFLKFNNTDELIKKNRNILLEKFPSWYKNKYFKKQKIKFKIMCYLVIHNKIKLLRIIFGGKL